MKHSDLTCYFHGEMPLWETRAPSLLVDWLEGAERLEVPMHQRLPKPQSEKGAIWIVTRHWRRSLAEARRFPRHRVFLSVLNLHGLPPSLPTLFLRRFRPAAPHNVTMISHCPLTHRFFREIEGLSESQVSLMPLPCTGPLPVSRDPNRPFTVGIMDIFNREANLNYVMGVAHYVCQQDRTAQFRLIGVGKLTTHLKRMIHDLGLSGRVQLVDTISDEAVAQLDLLLYVPVRNDHFTPLLAAAHCRVPVLATELQGISEYITEGQDGYILPLNEIRPMGELVLRFQREPALRLGFAERLAVSLRERFSLERVGARWESLLTNASSTPARATVAA